VKGSTPARRLSPTDHVQRSGAVATPSSSTGRIAPTSGPAAGQHIPGYALVARLPSRRREIYDALEDRPPWRRVALALGRVGAIADALRRLDHPGIVHLIADHGDAVALSWVGGRRLDRAMPALSGEQRLDVAIQVAEIVAHTHERGVVLRDLKPGNLLLDGGKLVLVDLDLAMCDDAAPREHEAGGTWGWSAPEQAVLEPTQIDLRADLYAIGTTLYFLFSGEPLFSRGAAAVREQFAEDRFEERADRVPAMVVPILRTLLQLERTARTTSASAVAAALRALRSERVTVAPAPEPPAVPRDGVISQLADVVRSVQAPRSDDDALEAALALEITSARPARALALALRTDRPGALAMLADQCGEWLERAGRLTWHERAARQARGRGADDTGAVLAVRGTALLALARHGDPAHGAALAGCIAQLAEAPATRGHGCALDLLDRIQRGDGGAVEALQHALLDGTLAPPHAALLYRTPLADALARGAAATRLCEAMLLALVGLDREAAAIELSPLDAARLALATGRRDDAIALVATVPPSEVAEQIRALATRDVDALRAAYHAEATWESAYWLCHALVDVGRPVECVPVVDAVWQREGRDGILAGFRAAGLAAEPSSDPPDELGRRVQAKAAIAFAEQDWESLYEAGAVTLALDPANAEARAELALASLERGEATNALAFARQAVAMRPDSEVAWDLIILAERELGAGDPLASARAALRACPDSARLRCRLAEALAAAGDDEALATSEEATRLGPGDRTTWAVHAGLLLDAGRSVDAIHVAASFESACGPGYDVHAIRLRAWLLRGELERAVAAGLAGVAADAGQPLLWRDLALAWIGLGEIADARNALAVIACCGAEDPALAFYLDLTGEAAGLVAGGGPAIAPHHDPDLGFVAAIARLAVDVEAALAALRSVRAGKPDYTPGFAARIALRGIAPALVARIEARLAERLAEAPRELGWAGTLCFLARDRAATAAAFAARALALVSDEALWLVAAEAAVLAGDEPLAARAMPHLGTHPAVRLARRLRCA
jgi:tetratricopeptide (TPR) repeat protein